MKPKLTMNELAKAAGLASLALPAIAHGESKFWLQTPQTPIAPELYDLHAIVRYLRSAIGPEPAQP